MMIHIGGDVSKGYADFCVLGEDGAILHEERFDDTRRGHQRMRALVRELSRAYPEASLVAGVEATGALELNWLGLFEELQDEVDLTAYQVNPFVVKRFGEQVLHASKTDASSARLVARYLLEGPRKEARPYRSDQARSGLRTLTRRTLNMIQEASRLKSELQTLLQRAHPELIQYCRSNWPQWLLKLIRRYPTPDRLAMATPEEVAEIPYLSQERARRLVQAARESIASHRDEATAYTLEAMAEDLLRLTRRINEHKKQLWSRVSPCPGAQILYSIEGIGRWTATVLYCEIGPIEHFASSKKLVAFAGLDPVHEESGDRTTSASISKRGNHRMRAALYTSVEAALRERSNPPLSALYDRLRAKGKPHMVAVVACMRKLLAIIYGCWTKGEPFDPGFERRLKQRQSAEKSSKKDNSSTDRDAAELADLSAPVSQREARRRRGENAQPQKSFRSSARGQGASP